jgi:hypothetical protein
VCRGSPATCGLCQRGVARGAYTRSDSQGAFRRQQACLAFLDQLRPCGRSTYLSTATTETLANSPSGSDWRMRQLLNLAERRWGLATAREPVAHRPGQRPIPLGVGSLISHSHVGGCVP